MKPEDFSKKKDEGFQSKDDKKLIGRREVISKAGWYALSATTMMVLMKSQPAMAQSPPTSSLPALPNPPSSAGQEWRRTNRT